ncbi:MAG: formylglycine-generating enzyme family protein [Tepidisphaera sp.]
MAKEHGSCPTLRAFTAAALGLAVAAPLAWGQPSGGYGWATIGNPGNRTANEQEAPFWPGLGRVDYEYRLSQTETTNAQWLEFLNAYRPYYQGNPRDDTALTGFWIGLDRNDQFYIEQDAGTVAVAVSWRNMARYCNWLHNDKASGAWAFETGAYDTSTFTQNPDGSLNDASTHLPGAKYWIPTADEWTKAAWYDPNRYGPGQEGYWTYIGGGETVLRSGLPWEGGQTSAGFNIPDWVGGLPVGAYGAFGPWGLCDMSGGVMEWNELSAFGGRGRGVLGSELGDVFQDETDRLRSARIDNPVLGLVGLRLASNVPSPSVLTLLVIGILIPARRKDRT